MTKKRTKQQTTVEIALPEGTIRTTPDKRVSIYDEIRIATGQSNPHVIWNRLKKQYPEALTKCESYKFPGRGQLPTPVANKQTFLEILSLLPGETAKKFREESAKLVIRYLEGDPTLAEEVIDQQDDPDILHRLALRAKSIGVRKEFTETLRCHGAITHGFTNTYAQCTGLLNKSVTGNTSKTIQAYTGIKKTRDALPSVYLSLIITGEELTTANIHKKRSMGHAALCEATAEVAADLEVLRQKYGIADFPEGQVA